MCTILFATMYRAEVGVYHVYTNSMSLSIVVVFLRVRREFSECGRLCSGGVVFFLSAKFVHVHCTFLLYVCLYRLYYFVLCYLDGCGLVSNCLLL